MDRNRIWLASILLVGAFVTSGCADKVTASESRGDPAAQLEVVEGSDVPRVVLTDRGVSRIGLETVTFEGSTVPYGAIVYDAEGATFVYASPGELTYRRTPVTVASVEGDQATLSAGPPAGSEVVVVGTAELFGVEQGIGG